MSHFNVSLIAWANSQDSVHKPQFFEEKRKESRSGSNQGLSAYQPSALPLGHTGSQSVHLGCSPFVVHGGSGNRCVRGIIPICLLCQVYLLELFLKRFLFQVGGFVRYVRTYIPSIPV